MASFADEVQKATRELSAFSNGLRTARTGVAAGAGQGGAAPRAGAGSGLVSGAVAAAGVVGGALAIGGAVRALSPAAGAYAVSGSTESLAVGATQSALKAIGSTSIGGFALEALGVKGALTANERAQQDVLGVTRDLAALGFDLPDDKRRGLFKAVQQQQVRVLAEEEKVARIAGSAESIEGARTAGAGAGFDALVSVMRSIEQLLRAQGNTRGGVSR